MKTIIIFIVIFLASSLAFGQKTKKDIYKIRARGYQLLVTYQGKTHTLKTTSEQIDAAKVTETNILFANRKDDSTYLVVDVIGQSREKENDRQCGAGAEANLIWIKLNAKWQIADIKSERYESCWSSITSTDGYKIAGKTLSIEFDNFRDDLNIKLIYNADKPEEGFQLEKKALDNK
ncbi:MAG: hypothetical protein WA584_01335 [Pyrinomonadaceae bacterium]